MKSITDRIDTLAWEGIATDLNERGWATTGPLLTVQECAELTTSYDDDALFRSRVVMARHGFGQGEYRYYFYPLPDLVSSLRASLYKRLVAVANEWRCTLGEAELYPPQHSDYLHRCHQAGQTRPTPLLLRYGEGDYNCLHQDLYGEHVFPLQAAFLLAEPGEDFEGGEFVLTEQRPRMQSRVHVVPLLRGEAVMFAVNERPVIGTRGRYKVRMKHGVSPVRRGQRHTLGVIFHDAA
jgi:hypothetical protein